MNQSLLRKMVNKTNSCRLGNRASNASKASPWRHAADNQEQEGYDLNRIFGADIFPPSTKFASTSKTSQLESSPEETPSGEQAVTPEDDWLTPKIYKGTNIS